MSRIALVRPPADALDDGVVDHIEKVAVDVTRARRQWSRYVATLESAGWTTIEVPVSQAHPDSVFVEDTVVMFRNVAVLARAGHLSRRGEGDAVEQLLQGLGASINRVNAPGTLDGGDVLKVGDTVYVGLTGRTNGSGISALRSALAPIGASIVPVPVTKVLHLKTAVTALPDGTVIGFEPQVDEPRLFDRFLPVPEEHGSAVVCLSDEDLLISASAPRTADLLTRLGYRVHPVEIDEFEKLEGCVTCLSVRVRGLHEG